MTVTMLSDIQERIQRNSERNSRALDMFEDILNKRDMNVDRMRKRNPIEDKALSSYLKK